ncbi:hypothetical protein [Lentzea aerocolonigenes]|nr:hypothetical protein [Lentzea aerocolonigenes]
METRPVPEPGPGEVAVSVHCGGVGGSDLRCGGAVGGFRLRD